MNQSYLRVQFAVAVTISRSPYAKASEVTQEEGFAIEDDGPGHVRVTKGDSIVRVPWNNIAGAVPGPVFVALPVGTKVALDSAINEAASTAVVASKGVIERVIELTPQQAAGLQIRAELPPARKGKR